MQDFCSQLNGSAVVGSGVWNENKGTTHEEDLVDSRHFLQNPILEASTGAVSTPNSIPSSVIFSSNYCGVKGAADNSDNASSLIYSAAHFSNSLSSSSQASVPAEAASHGVGASTVCRRSLNLDYGDSQHSNSQSAQFSPIASQSHFASSPNVRVDSSAMWNVANSCDGTQGSSSINQIPQQGAKSAHSEASSSSCNSSLQQATSISENLNNCLSNNLDMQTNVQKKMDSSSRYNNNSNNSDAVTSSHSANGSMNACYMSSNGVYCSCMGCGNGGHSNNNLQLLNIGANSESNGSHSQNASFGAQFNNTAGSRAKSQANSCESNFSSPYSGWQGLNTSTTSVPSSNGWIIPNNMSSRKAHDSSCRLGPSDGSSKDGEENMLVDNEMSYSDLIGATGRTESEEDKAPTQTNGKSNMSYGMSGRLGLLGGGENSVNSGSNGWNNSQGPATSSGSSARDSNNRQSNGSSTDTGDNSDMMVDNQSGYSDLIGATGGSDYVEGKSNGSNGYKQEQSRPVPPRLGLLGGGESSLNTASSGWDGNGSAGTGGSNWVGGGPRSNNGSSDMSGNNGSGMSPPKPHNSWAQAAGKGLNQPQSNTNGNSGHNMSPPVTEVRGSTTDSSSASKAQNDAAMEIRMKAAVSEGWGKIPINQDTPWELPLSSPSSEPQAMKDGAPHVWRPPVNNGIEIWENNLRMKKGVPAPVTTTAPPWGHTPSTNIGGHWGDDDSSNNTWNGAPQPNTAGNSNWSEPSSNPPNTMWVNTNPPPPVAEKHWDGSNSNTQAGPSWNDNMVGPDNGAAMWNPPVAKQRNVGNWSPASTPKKEMPPSGWELPSPPTNRRPLVTNYDDGTSVWGNPQRQGKVSHWKDMPSAKPIMNNNGNMGNPSVMPPMSGNMQPSGPGMIRLPSGATVNNKNDMGSTWVKPPMNRNPGWQEMQSHDGPNIGTWGEETMHMNNPMKNMPGNNNIGGGAFGNSGGWSEQQNNSMSAYWSNKSKGNNSWADGQVDTSSWLGPSKQCGKPLTRDLIWASKQFRLLVELGFKKEDAENALRNNNMNLDDAVVELRASSGDGNMMDVDGFHGRKVRPANIADDITMSENMLDPNYGAGNFHGPGFQTGGNFQGIGNIGAFKPQVKGPNNASTLLNAALGGQQSNIGSIGNFSPAVFQKILQQHQPPQSTMQQFAPNMQQLNNQSSRVGQSNFPSTAQLRHLVQQIQMAVHAGHLNPQILNQPLAPQTLQLLYQLLQQIKVLHQLQNTPKSAMAGGGLQLNVQITQTKQRIINLQNQINAQQAVFLKQQVPLQPAQLHNPQGSTDMYKPNLEPMPSALHNEFRDLSIKDVPLQTHQQSRLTQWKLPPSYDKEENPLCISSNEFIRAPGPLPSKTSSASSSGPNLHPLLSQGDSAWSTLSRSQSESGWPESTAPLTGLTDNSTGSGNVPVSAAVPSNLSVGNNNGSNLDTKEPSTIPPSSGPSTSSASHTTSVYNLTDLVPEFEPGKPWKGTQLKNIEDDPHITPGSIARSPLSVNTIKDTDLFWNAKSSSASTSGNDTSGSLASSTWMFTQSNTTMTNSSSGLPSKAGKNWSTSDSSAGSDMWDSKPRGPPPGISAQGWERQGNSFLLLRNLTPQIDGSTLKTLCMQHGPLVLFHLSLNHGLALVRYSSKEEASKAQSALNNCVLGNTTILADIPNEGEIQQYLALLSNQNTGNIPWSGSQQGSSSSGGSNNSNNNTSAFRSGNNVAMQTYLFNVPSGNSTNGAGKQQDSAGWNGNNLNMPSQLWSFPNTSSALWGSSQPINDHESSTNPSLNRFLPDDLLGGEPV